MVREAILSADFSLEMCPAKGNVLRYEMLLHSLKLPKEVCSHLDIVYALLPIKLSLPILPLKLASCISRE